MKKASPPPYQPGDRVAIKNTNAAKKFGEPGATGEVLSSTSESTWVLFKRARTDQDTWIPNEHLEPGRPPAPPKPAED